MKLAEVGLEGWPGAKGSYANGDTVFHHDMQHKRIRGHDYLLVSYWDTGQVLLNIDDPATPVFVGDSDFRFPDPLMPESSSRRGTATSPIGSRQRVRHLDGRGLLAVPDQFRDDDRSERGPVRCQ